MRIERHASEISNLKVQSKSESVGSCSSHRDTREENFSVICWPENQHDFSLSFQGLHKQCNETGGRAALSFLPNETKQSCEVAIRREDVRDTPNLNFFAKTFETATVDDFSICGRNEARFDRLQSGPAPKSSRDETFRHNSSKRFSISRKKRTIFDKNPNAQ